MSKRLRLGHHWILSIRGGAELKIQELSLEMYSQIKEAWASNAERMQDADRDAGLVDYLLFEDGGDSQWYQVEGHRAWLFVRNVVPGLSASLWALNMDGPAALPGARAVLGEIMSEFGLQRLTVSIPSPLVKVAHAAQQLGFKHEGRLRSAMVYSGRVVDADIFGLVAEREGTPSEGKKRRRRRRRSRRKGQASQAQAIQGQSEKKA